MHRVELKVWSFTTLPLRTSTERVPNAPCGVESVEFYYFAFKNFYGEGS